MSGSAGIRRYKPLSWNSRMSDYGGRVQAMIMIQNDDWGRGVRITCGMESEQREHDTNNQNITADKWDRVIITNPLR